MREEIIVPLVEVLHKHDDAENACVALARARGCLVSDLTAAEKAEHNLYEYLSMDMRVRATDEEYMEAIRRYDP